jgi:hypothetical protein
MEKWIALIQKRFYYGWGIARLAVISMAFWYGFRTTFSIFFVALIDRFQFCHFRSFYATIMITQIPLTD